MFGDIYFFSAPYVLDCFIPLSSLGVPDLIGGTLLTGSLF